MSTETQTNEKAPSGLRIRLKDFTEISADKIKDGMITVIDKEGNDRSADIDIEEIIQICKGIQDSSPSIIDLFGRDRKESLKLFGYNPAGGYSAQGYVGVLIDPNDNQIVIGSRFDRGEEKQYFLQYVFSKAFDENGKIFKDMNPTGRYETTWDLLIVFMFLQRLKEALRKGIFRKYRQFLYNDSSVKGQIDIARYIKLDIPENGRIAYRTREYTPDNYYNILFLRALSEMEKKHPQMVKNLLAGNPEVKKTLIILKSSIPEWNTVSIRTVLKNTEHKITHSVYRNYEQLRVISRIILRRLGFNVFDANREKAMGIVISMPTLWEKFLEKTVVSRFNGYQAQYKKYILNGKREIKPDFYLEFKGQRSPIRLVLDAKYKNNWKETIDTDTGNNDNTWYNIREDVFQIMAYMLSLKCNAGGVIFPYPCGSDRELTEKREDFYKELEKLSVFPHPENPDRYFFRLPYLIPDYRNSDFSYRDFAEKMEKNAERMIEVLQKTMSGQEET